MATKAISIFGDSISTFEGACADENRVYYDAADSNGTGVHRLEDTWWTQVADDMDATILANASFSGSMVEGSGFPAGSSKQRAAQILGPQGQAPDAVLVFMGINDYGWGGADAQARGGSEAAPTGASHREEGFVPGLAPAGTLQAFARAYDEMLEHLRDAAPNAEVWCMTIPPGRVQGESASTFCPTLRGISIDDYNSAIRCAAYANGCQVADVAAFNLDYESTDGTHPTVTGMKQIANLALAAMEGGEPDPLLFAGMEAVRSCEEDHCVGCPHARSTGIPWFCVCEKSKDDGSPVQ